MKSLVVILIFFLCLVIDCDSAFAVSPIKFPSILSPLHPCLEENAIPTPLSPPQSSCAAGFYCPHLNSSDSDTFPSICLPTPQCFESLTTGQFCSPQGYYEPLICPSGYYCPLNSIEIYECPENYFCPIGSSIPYPCSKLFSICPKQSKAETNYMGILLLILVDLLLLISYCIYNRQQKYKILNAKYTNEIQLDVNENNNNENNNNSRKQRNQSSSSSYSSPLLNKAGSDYLSLSDSESSSGPALSLSELAAQRSLNRNIEILNLYQRAREDRLKAKSSHSAVNSASNSTASPTSSPSISSHFDIHFSNLSISSNSSSGKEIFHDLSGSIFSGELTGIVGPLDGKESLLLNALMNRHEGIKVNGELMIGELKGGNSNNNNKSFQYDNDNNTNSNIGYDNLKVLSDQISFVPEQLSVHTELSAYEVLSYSAANRLPLSWNSHQRNQLIHYILSLLDLNSVRHTPIGNDFNRGLSGGQKKRTNIGIELSSAPIALFLQEPLSGLDSSTSYEIMKSLHYISTSMDLGIIISINQLRPEIWNLFHRIIVFDHHGNCIFQGPREKLELYMKELGLGNSNKNDMNDIENENKSDYTNNSNNNNNSNPIDILLDYLYENQSNELEMYKRWKNQWENEQLIEDQERRKLRIINNNNRNNNSIEIQNQQFKDELSLLNPFNTVGEANNNKKNNNNNNNHSDNQRNYQYYFGSYKNSIINQFQLFYQFIKSILFYYYLSHRRAILQLLSNPFSIISECFVAIILSFALSSEGQTDYAGPLQGAYFPLSPASSFAYNTYSFYMMLSIMGSASTPAVQQYGIKEQHISSRELYSGHSYFAYYSSRFTIILYRCLLSSLHFTPLLQILLEPPIEFYIHYYIIFLIYFNIYSIACLISCITQDENGRLLLIMICSAMITTCGYLQSSYPDWLKISLFPYYFNEIYLNYNLNIAPTNQIFQISTGLYSFASHWNISMNSDYFNGISIIHFDLLLLHLFPLLFFFIGYWAFKWKIKHL